MMYTWVVYHSVLWSILVESGWFTVDVTPRGIAYMLKIEKEGKS